MEAADLPHDVLVVEDNMIIALDAESALMRAGIETVRVASSVAQAMKAIETRAPDFALLDINLGRETSFAIAEHLASLGIRFVFTTGYGEDIAFPPKLLGVPRVRKPYTRRCAAGGDAPLVGGEDVAAVLAEQQPPRDGAVQQVPGDAVDEGGAVGAGHVEQDAAHPAAQRHADQRR